MWKIWHFGKLQDDSLDSCLSLCDTGNAAMAHHPPQIIRVTRLLYWTTLSTEVAAVKTDDGYDVLNAGVTQLVVSLSQ